jgi:glutathione peroxidase
MTSLYDFTAEASDGTRVPLQHFQGNVVLVVNTASKCGFTPQYEDLQKLHEDLAGRGLSILCFPCNQFAHQEPGDAAEIESFCRLNYDVGFPIFAKIDVNGKKAHPLYQWLKKQAKGLFASESIKWNFTKFLIDRQGRVVGRFPPTKRPQSMRPVIEKILGP